MEASHPSSSEPRSPKKQNPWRVISALLHRYFDLRTDEVAEEKIIANITADASFSGANLWVLIFAIFVASLGLNVNSTAVIIGAMLISPLMGPIVGMGLSIGINDLELFKSSAKNYAVATIVSVMTATLYFLLSPYKELQSELLARTSPTLYDVMIAFFGGAAGIVGIATGGKGNIIPGVAIATALMPPLCTAGYGLATGQWLFFLGAFYLFFINTVFISLATYLGVRFMGFKAHQDVSPERAVKTRRVIMSIIVLTMVPAAFLTFNLVRQSLFNQMVAQFVESELSWDGTQILSQEVDDEGMLLRVAIIGREVENDEIAKAEQQLAEYKLQGYHLDIIQGTQSDSLANLVGQLQTSKSDYSQTVLRQNQQIHDLETALARYERFEKLADELRPELQVLYPQIQTISLAKTVEARTDTALVTPVTVALVALQPKQQLSAEQTLRLKDWLTARTSADSLRVVCTE